MAYYDAAHLRKLNHIRESRQQGSPLIAIRKEIAEMETGRSNGLEYALSEAACSERKGPVRQKHPQKTQGKKTREAILERGCDLFRQKGYKDTKVSDITSALKIGKGTFYFYFSEGLPRRRSIDMKST